MKKAVVIGVALGLAVGLAGCSNPEGITRTGTDVGWAVAQPVDLPDGGNSYVCDYQFGSKLRLG